MLPFVQSQSVDSYAPLFRSFAASWCVHNLATQAAVLRGQRPSSILVGWAGQDEDGDTYVIASPI